MTNLERIETLEKEIEQLKKECSTKYPIYCRSNSWEEIAYDEERGLYDKQVVWCWDDNTYIMYVTFYDAINKCTFSSMGIRDGFEFDNYEAVEQSQIPKWMLDAYDALED